MAIPSVRSIATVSLDAAWEGDSRAEFKMRKAECIQLCYKALEQLSNFIIPEIVPIEVSSTKYKSTVLPILEFLDLDKFLF